MRKITAAALALCCMLFCAAGLLPAAAALPSVSAQSAIVMEVSGSVLYERDAEKKLPMASTTKIMTALVALESCPLDRTVSVSPLAVGVEGSSVYLYAGEQLTMEQLVFALMLESANDAAAAIALEVAGGIDEFAALMNEKAAEIGLENTHFCNPHGLDSEEHYTTAHDLALLTAHALENETFRSIVSTYKKIIPQGESGARLLMNHNRFLKRYPGAIGVKTGFTKRSGRCLVTAAERNGVLLVAVTLNAPDDWNDHEQLLDYGFSHCESRLLAGDGELSYDLPVVGGSPGFVRVKNRGEAKVSIAHSGDSAGEVTSVTELKRFYFAPVEKGDILGYVRYYYEGAEIAALPLCAETSAEKPDERGFFRRLLDSLFG